MIIGWVGRPGAGKTYAMVREVLLQHAGKRPVYANMDIHWGDGAADRVIPFESFDDLIGLSNGLVCIDEMGQWLAAREWQKVPREVLSKFSQHRKDGLSIYFTAQSPMQIDSYVRSQVMTLFWCERWGPFVKIRPEDPISGQKYPATWRLLSQRVFDAYDTLEVVAGANGGERRRGAAALGVTEGWAKEALRAAYCIEREDERSVWRQATLDDVVLEREIVQVRGGKVRALVVPDNVDLSVVSMPHHLRLTG